jgi:hypothetical protein
MREEKSKWRVVDSEADFANSRLAMDKTPTRIALGERDRLFRPSLQGEAVCAAPPPRWLIAP